MADSESECGYWPYHSTTFNYDPPSFWNRVRYLHYFELGVYQWSNKSPRNLVQIGPRRYQNTFVVFGSPLKMNEKL